MRLHNSIRSTPSGRHTMAALARLIGATLVAGAPSVVLAQIAPLSVVALSGDPAPGAGAGVTFATLTFNFAVGVPFMNNSGRVAFLTGLAGTGVSGVNDFAIYCGQPGSLSIVAREGAAAAELPGLTYGTLSEMPLFGGADAVSFRAVLAGAGVAAGNNDALFAGSAGAMALAAREGFFAPGTPGSTYFTFGTAAVSQTTTLAYGGSSTDGAGLWYGIPGSITSFARVGMEAPGFLAGSTYSAFVGPGAGAGATQVLVNSAGQVAYRGAAFDMEVLGVRGAIWGGTPGSTHLIAKVGDEAEGFFGDPLGTYSGFRNPVLTDSGAVAFQATIGGVPADRDSAIYRTIILGEMDHVIGEGDPAPGTSGVFQTLDDTASGGSGVPRMNNAHGVAFFARVTGVGITGDNDEGVWGHNDIGSLSRLLYESEPVAAAGAGVTVDGIAAVPPALNNANRIAARVTLAGPGVGIANDTAILARNGVGDLVVALREGQSVEIPGSGTRTITGLPVADLVVGPGVQNGASTAWTDDCRLLVRASISDGRTGLFIADVNATCRASVTDQPDGASIAEGSDAAMSVTIAAGFIAGSYQWKRDGADIIDGPGGASAGGGDVSGASGLLTSPHDGSPIALTITGAQASDSGAYTVVLTNICGNTPTIPAALAVVPPACPGDADGNGLVEFADITSVLGNWGADYSPGTGPGDADGNGVVNFGDITSVLGNWGGTCG